MITAIIIDDEPNNIDNLKSLLDQHCPQVEVKGTAKNADEGALLINRLQPDLVLLDIQMPDKNGFEMLQSLSSYDFEVIFVTAYDQYGMQAVKFSAIDYLLKPVNVEELISAVGKVLKRTKMRKENLLLNNLMQYIQNNKSGHKLALSTLKETRFVSPEEIIRCESSNAYTLFYLHEQQRITVSRPIFEYEEILSGYGFLRCHQSHLVNRHFIKSWVKENGGYLLLNDGTRIPVSRSKKDAILKELGKH